MGVPVEDRILMSQLAVEHYKDRIEVHRLQQQFFELHVEYLQAPKGWARRAIRRRLWTISADMVVARERMSRCGIDTICGKFGLGKSYLANVIYSTFQNGRGRNT